MAVLTEFERTAWSFDWRLELNNASLCCGFKVLDARQDTEEFPTSMKQKCNRTAEPEAQRLIGKSRFLTRRSKVLVVPNWISGLIPFSAAWRPSRVFGPPPQAMPSIVRILELTLKERPAVTTSALVRTGSHFPAIRLDCLWRKLPSTRQLHPFTKLESSASRNSATAGHFLRRPTFPRVI